MTSSTVSCLKLDAKHQKEIIESLDNVESLIYDWLHGAKSKDHWKHHKTAINDHLNITCDKTKEIVVHSLSLKDTKNKKFTIWKTVGYLPCANPRTAIEYYTNPKHHLDYDDPGTMSKLDQFTLEMEHQKDDINFDINVAVTNSRLNGWISERLSTNINCSKYSTKMNNWCCLGRFVKESMLKQIKDKLGITKKEMKHTQSKNLNLYWGAKPITINNNINLTKITYILQVNNGGWIPQWAVEMGLIDQHMIAIFKQITKWINSNDNNKENIVKEKEKIMIQNVERMAHELKHANEQKIDESEDDTDTAGGVLSADSNITQDSTMERFSKFIDKKGSDWIQVSDNEQENSFCYYDDRDGDEYKMIQQIVYNKIQDLEIEESNSDQEDIEIIKLNDYADDEDELLSDGVYVNNADELKREQQRCGCLSPKNTECLIM